MCGIAGFIDSRVSREQRETAVGRMCAAMRHRGPDDDGMFSDAHATLGMRRLAIFDPANGHQPMRSPDGRLTLVFNGAIYNHRELRGELELRGWSFRTRCDTEVLLAAFSVWGEACLGRLRGMYAFAVWDELRQSLFLARDPFGIKPLYLRHHDRQLLFASEVNALLASGAFSAEIDLIAVGEYLNWLAVPAPRTIYRDVISLRPGEYATFAADRLSIRRSWDFESIPAHIAPARSREDFSHELRARLEDSIRAHMLADVPVGSFLSGGLDSAVIAALMSRATPGKLKTFSIGFSEASFSEAAAAEETAAHLGTTHTTYQLTGREIAGDISGIIGGLDQPTGDAINTFYVSRVARAGGVTAALSGLGGDELFGGYPSFRDIPRIARWLPFWRATPPPVRRAIVTRLSQGDTRHRKLADFLQHGKTLHELASLQRRVFANTTRRALLAPGVAEVTESRPPFHPETGVLARELERANPSEAISAWELRTYMADVLLRDSDVMSMRHSLEVRVPFIDRPLIEWLWRQPVKFKHDPERPKAALFDATRDLLPPGLEHRRKQGFTMPFAVWMKNELRPFLDEVFSDASVGRSGLFARDGVQQFWRGFLAADDPREWSRVWSLAVLIAFLNRRPAA
jgi:asparagine synthase (glutamine-hydrolysing)